MNIFLNWLMPKKIVHVYEKPILKINRTIVPMSYLKKGIAWDSHLYTNQIVLND